MGSELKSMSIYLAGPIDSVTKDEARDWREYVWGLAPLGVLFFSPAHAFFGASTVTARELNHLERHVIAACDGMLVNLKHKITLGTVREIEFARARGLPVAVAGKVDSLMTFDLFVEDTLDAALDALMLAIRENQDAPQALMGMRIMFGGAVNQDDVDRLDELEDDE